MIETIVTAVVAGVAAGAGTASTSAVTDAYAALVTRIRRLVHRASDDDTGEVDDLIAEVESDPGAGQHKLAAALTDAQADQDPELVEAAHRLLALIEPDAVQSGKYRVHVQDSQGVIVGDDARVTFTFGPQ